jgi:hypothetical protein
LKNQPGQGMLIAIDADVEHGDALATGAIRGAQLLMLNGRRDAIAQITQAIQTFTGQFQSLHIVAHGSPGCLHFSNGDLTLGNLHHYAAQIESWFGYQPISPGSPIQIPPAHSFLSLYACRLADGEVGRAFLEKLQYLTGVSVHASSGKVGSTLLNGSWQLEVALPFPQQAKFPFTEDLLTAYSAECIAS